MVSVTVLLGMFVAGHIGSIRGEISALKGVQGLRGYPFQRLRPR